MEDGGVGLAHAETAPRCHRSQARCRSSRRRWNKRDGNANGSLRVRAGIPAERCWDPAAGPGTAREDGGEGDEHRDLMFPLSLQVSV